MHSSQQSKCWSPPNPVETHASAVSLLERGVFYSYIKAINNNNNNNILFYFLFIVIYSYGHMLSASSQDEPQALHNGNFTIVPYF